MTPTQRTLPGRAAEVAPDWDRATEVGWAGTPARLVTSRTPLRISFAGGGSDLPAFYSEEPGAVVTTAIDTYIDVTVRLRADSWIRATHTATETVETISALRHELIRESLRLVGPTKGIEITSLSSVSSGGSGLGSSSAFTVGLLNALHALAGRHTDPRTLAEQSCRVERDLCEKPIGKQDQYIAAYGGLRFIEFFPGGGVRVHTVACPPSTGERLARCLLLLDTGITRPAEAILLEQSRNLRRGPARGSVRAMVRLAHDLRRALESGDLWALGEILHAGWMEKRRLARGMTSAAIDDWYARARRAGAAGGKITGAGGGGFLLLFAPPDRHDAIRRALAPLRPMPVSLETDGSIITHREDAP